METKDQLPDFEKFSLTEEENRELSLALSKEKRASLFEIYNQSMEFLKLSWVQEKLKKRGRDFSSKDCAEFKI